MSISREAMSGLVPKPVTEGEDTTFEMQVLTNTNTMAIPIPIPWQYHVNTNMLVARSFDLNNVYPPQKLKIYFKFLKLFNFLYL